MEINTLISKYLFGEATIQEKLELKAWRNADESNEKEFQELVESWNLVHSEIQYLSLDKERVWNKIMSSIYQMQSVKMYSRTIFYLKVYSCPFSTINITRSVNASSPVGSYCFFRLAPKSAANV